MLVKFVLCNIKLVYVLCTIFLYISLGWYHNDLGWKYCLLFYPRKKTRLCFNQKFVYLVFIYRLSCMISSQNNLRIYRTKGHVQVYYELFFWLDCIRKKSFEQIGLQYSIRNPRFELKQTLAGKHVLLSHPGSHFRKPQFMLFIFAMRDFLHKSSSLAEFLWL